QKGRWAPTVRRTARDAVDDGVAGCDAGADAYFVKPFAFGELLARVRSVIRRGPVERPSVLEVDGLTLDPATREVQRNGEAIELSAKEFSLLEYFMRHPHEVLSRTQILEHVWDFAYDGTSNVVDVYVRYLRAKIDRPFVLDTIETVRGAGYRLHKTAVGGCPLTPRRRPAAVPAG